MLEYTRLDQDMWIKIHSYQSPSRYSWWVNVFVQNLKSIIVILWELNSPIVVFIGLEYAKAYVGGWYIRETDAVQICKLLDCCRRQLHLRRYVQLSLIGTYWTDSQITEFWLSMYVLILLRNLIQRKERSRRIGVERLRKYRDRTVWKIIQVWAYGRIL
jgi:hypothetical protein